MILSHRIFIAVTTIGCVPSLSAIAADAPLAHIRGTIVAKTATRFDVRTTAGIVHVGYGDRLKVLQIVPSSIDAIKPNAFVGIASNGDAPGARAREVVVFPEAARGTGEGHYGWDLPSGGNTMTNGTVAAPKSMMTNGSVSSKMGAGATIVNVAYKGGSNRIAIPPGTPVVTFVPGSPALVVNGAHVVVFATAATGHPNALSVFVGKDALVPPM